MQDTKRTLCAPFDHLHTTLQTAVEVTLAATTGQDLSLDDQLVGAEALGYFVGLFRRLCSFALGREDAILDCRERISPTCPQDRSRNEAYFV